jgi:hypothetical protein
MFNELNTAIYNKLSAGTTLTNLLGGTAIYYLQAPNDTALPYVVWSFQGGGDENQISLRMKNIVMYVRGYAESHSAAGSIADAIDDLLHDGSVTAAGWTNFWATGIQDIGLVENLPGGKQVYSAGGLYRFRFIE